MKKIILIISLIFFTLSGFSQNQREVKVKPYIDKSPEFKEILQFWNNYMEELNLKNYQAGFKMEEMDNSLKKYWVKEDTMRFKFPDLYFAFRRGYGNTFYPMCKERFLGVARRDTNLYELRTMFMAMAHDEFPAIMMTVPVVKSGDSYKLRNKLSLTIPELKTKKFGNIIYYYDPSFDFNVSNAVKLRERVKKFKQAFDIENNDQITYFVADNMTEIAQWFGINYYEFDYSQSTSIITGRAITNSNIVLSAGAGENFLHEIIHILLEEYARGDYSLFEEGIASFFGEHQMHSYLHNVKRLKSYLNKNDWIDLSLGIDGYYRSDQKAHTYQKESDTIRYTRMRYGDGHTNFSYIIHSVLCDMAYRKGGYEKVKEMYLDKADNPEEFYAVIERHLGITKDETHQSIKAFLDENY